MPPPAPTRAKRPAFALGQHVWVRMGAASAAAGLLRSLPDGGGYVRVEWPAPSAWGAEAFHVRDVEPMFEEGGERPSRSRSGRRRRDRERADAHGPPPPSGAGARDASEVKAAARTTNAAGGNRAREGPRKVSTNRADRAAKESPKKRASAKVKRKFAGRRGPAAVLAGDLSRNVWVVNGRTQHAATLVSRRGDGTVRIRWHTTLNFDDVDSADVTPMFPEEGCRSGRVPGRKDRECGGPAAAAPSEPAARARSDRRGDAPMRSSGRRRVATDFYRPPDPSEATMQARTAAPSPDSKTSRPPAPTRSSGRRRVATDFYRPPNPGEGTRARATPSPNAGAKTADRRREGAAGVLAPTRSSGRRRFATDYYRPPNPDEGTRARATPSPNPRAKAAGRKGQPVRRKRANAGRTPPGRRPGAPGPSPDRATPPLYARYMIPVERTNHEVGGSGMVLRRTTVACNLLRFRASTFRLRLHDRVVLLERWGRRDEALGLLGQLYEHESAGREGEGPEGLMREILGEDYMCDGDVEILDGGGCKSESRGPAAEMPASGDVVDLCDDESVQSDCEAAAKPAEVMKATPIKVKTEKDSSAVSTDSSASDDESSAEDDDEAWSGSASDFDDSDATVPYCAPRKKIRRMPGAGSAARRRSPREVIP